MPLNKTSVLSLGTASVQSVEKKYSDDGPRATLIVCPLSVLSNWIVSAKLFQCVNVIYVDYDAVEIVLPVVSRASKRSWFSFFMKQSCFHKGGLFDSNLKTGVVL